MRQARALLVAKIGKVLSALLFSAVGFATLTMSSAGATSGSLSCTATVLDTRPHSYSIVIINVVTKAGAGVSGTESAEGHSWSMTPDATANASGHARLYQKVSAVSRDEVVKVVVHVSLEGSAGHCTTRYTPPSLLPLT
jgi:hypothetical protein